MSYTFSNNFSFSINDVSYGDQDETAYNVSGNGYMQVTITVDASGNVSGTGSVASHLAGLPTGEQDGDPDTVNTSGLGDVTVSGTANNVQITGTLSDGEVVSFQGKVGMIIQNPDLTTLILPPNVGTTITGSMSISDPTNTLSKNVTLPLTISLPNSAIMNAVYSQARAEFDPVTQPDAFLAYCYQIIRQTRDTKGNSLDLTLRDAEYYIIGLQAGRGSPIQMSWAAMAFPYDGLKWVTQQLGIGDILRTNRSNPTTPPGGSLALMAGIDDTTGPSPAWLQNAQNTKTDPTITVYQRQATTGSEDVIQGQFDYHIVYGSNVPNSGNLVIFDALPNTPLDVSASTDDKIIESVNGQTIRAGTGNVSILLHGGKNLVYLGAGSAFVLGGTGQDTIFCGPGSDTIIGGPGTTVAVLNVPSTAVSISPGLYGVVVTYGNATDTFANVKQIAFTDKTVSLSTPATGDMITSNSKTGVREIYNIGNNGLMSAYQLGTVGTDWQFVGLGGFNGIDTSDMVLRNSNTGAFEVYDVSNNQLTGAGALGTVGLNWQFGGFGDFSSQPSETDMILRNAGNGTLEVYDIANNALTSAFSMGAVGLNWQIAGFGNFSSNDGESDMLMRDVNTGTFEVYDIANNGLVSASSLGTVGLNWQVVGFADFSGTVDETDMLLRNSNTGAFEIYSINTNKITGAAPMGTVGLNWQVVGFGPLNGFNSTDMVLRNSTTGAFEIYDIIESSLEAAAPMGAVGLDWQVGGIATLLPGGTAGVPGLDGFAADPPTGSMGSSGSTSQLVQAMAGFGGGSGAGGGLNSAALGADTSQQTLLTVPQHA